MRTASPWWLSLALGIGLLLVLLGERVLDTSGLHWVLTGIGIGAVAAVTAARAWAMASTSGARRGVERTLLACHLATLVGLVLYLLTTDWGMAKLDFAEPTATHFKGAVTVLYAAIILASIVPVAMIELGLGNAMRDNFDLDQSVDDEGVEFLRVRDIGWSGLSVALATAFLLVTCHVASERNVQKDVSYFKTSSPGESTRNIVLSSSEPIHVYLFFPPTNEVADQITGYFEQLDQATGKVTVEAKSRLVDKDIAEKYKAEDGSVVIVKGKDKDEKFQAFKIDTDLEKARKTTGKLRTLDKEVNSALLKIVHEKRKLYFVGGHGEMTDPDSMPSEMKRKIQWPRATTAIRRRLGELNYDIKDLPQIDLLRDVPGDATIVALFSPTVPLQDAEWAALGRYLDRGGRLLLAFDPKGEAGMGLLSGKLGVKFNPGALSDDTTHFPISRTKYDKRFVGTANFSAHASTTALSRAGKGMLPLIESGALEDAPFAVAGAQPTKTYTIQSLETSYLDLNDNFQLDAPIEKKDKWHIAAAIEGPKLGDKDGFRALVFADVDLFADIDWVVGRPAGFPISGPLIDDAVHWLGGEESFVGEVVSEEDKPISHTKGQDNVWFTLTIVGAPLVVLVLGLVGTWARRRRAKRAVEVMP